MASKTPASSRKAIRSFKGSCRHRYFMLIYTSPRDSHPRTSLLVRPERDTVTTHFPTNALHLEVTGAEAKSVRARLDDAITLAESMARKEGRCGVGYPPRLWAVQRENFSGSPVRHHPRIPRLGPENQRESLLLAVRFAQAAPMPPSGRRALQALPPA